MIRMPLQIRGSIQISPTPFVEGGADSPFLKGARGILILSFSLKKPLI